MLQHQNQKLSQKLEAQKIEIAALESKFFEQKEKQQPYDSTLSLVQNSWEEVLLCALTVFVLEAALPHLFYCMMCTVYTEIQMSTWIFA